MKRSFDFAASACLLLVLCPIIILLAVLIKVTSSGPAVFAQTRVGRDEKPFKCLKFRTMRVDTPNVASHEASTSWITPVGRFLRKTKLDELPQLWNVVCGEMSLVGPRPCLPTQDKLVTERRRLGVFSVRPGITGSAQIAGLDMSEPVKLAAADRRYLDERSFLGDIDILIRTALGKGSGDAAGR